ncbi:MAG: hypothetical protein WD607_02640 [Candidatus Paceibacterota bacterium]
MKSIYTQTAEIYDEYVKYYNNSGNSKGTRISIFSEFVTIEQNVIEFKTAKESVLHGAYEQLHHSLCYTPKQELLEKHPDINLGPFKVKLMDAIKAHELNSSGKNHIFSFDDLNSLFINILRIYKGIKVRSGRELLETDIFELAEAINKVNHSQRHISALNQINYRILDEFYPTQLRFYKELSDHEKKEILDNKSPGANPKKEVPQVKIEELVKECIKDKSSKRFIHQSGQQKGKANQSQIYEFIESNYPIMVKGVGADPDKGVVKRTIIRRIVKALPDDMT